jgi:hypothetical protein
MLGRPLVDRIQGGKIHHLEELRPGSARRSEIRVLFECDPACPVLLAALWYHLISLPAEVIPSG